MEHPPARRRCSHDVQRGVTPAAYRPVTAAVALPPRLPVTVMLMGLAGQENLPVDLVRFLVNVPMSVSVEVT